MTLNLIGAAVAPRRGNPRLVLLTTCLGVLIAQLDTSVVNLALKPIGADLHLGVSTLQWVVDAYNLVYACLLLTAGTVGDLYGRRLVFASGVALFTIGSIACGFAPGETLLIAGRAISGLGAALMLPISLAILAIAYPDAKARAHAIGVWASCYGLALAISPTIGGLLVDAFGWRSIFLLIVPVSLLALGMTSFLPETKDPQGRQLDLPGQVLGIAALVTLTLAAIEAPDWSPRAIWFCAGASMLAAALFIAVEARTEGALLPLDCLRAGSLPVAMALAALMTFGMYAMLFLMPLYLQEQRGESVFAAGLELLPLSLPYIFVSRRTGAWTARFGPWPLMTAGMGLMGAGLYCLAFLAPGRSLITVEAEFMVLGIGLGLNTGPVNSVAVSSLPPARSGIASGLLNTARMVGATLGVGVLGALFAAHARQGSPDGFFTGLRAAFLVGGSGELLGSAIAFACARRVAASHKRR
jgi:EmrB/QacA subfamily drug resistance transporter